MLSKLLFFFFLLATPKVHAADLSFGKITLQDSSAMSLKLALDQYQEGQSTGLLVKGTVKKVCEEKGCWLSLEDQGRSVRVFFKNYGFFVSNKIKDKPVLVEGTLLRKVRTVAEQKHLAKDSGEAPAVIDAIKDDKTFFEFEASGVKAI